MIVKETTTIGRRFYHLIYPIKRRTNPFLFWYTKRFSHLIETFLPEKKTHVSFSPSSSFLKERVPLFPYNEMTGYYPLRKDTRLVCSLPSTKTTEKIRKVSRNPLLPVRKDYRQKSLYPYTPKGYYPYTPYLLPDTYPVKDTGYRGSIPLGYRGTRIFVCSLFVRGEEDSGRLFVSFL